MSATTVLAIAIPIIVIIAVVGVIAAARRRDTHDATGTLSRETKRRDKSELARCCPSRPTSRAGARSKRPPPQPGRVAAPR